MISLTDFQRRALEFIRDNPNVHAADIGQHLWPGHLMHRKPAGDRGGGNVGALVAAGHMGRLQAVGLICGSSGSYRLTSRGPCALGRKS